MEKEIYNVKKKTRNTSCLVKITDYNIRITKLKIKHLILLLKF